MTASSKYAGQACLGVQVHVTGLDVLDPVAAGLALMEEIRRLHPDRFDWFTHNGNNTIGRLLGVTHTGV